jgi:CreA protein
MNIGRIFTVFAITGLLALGAGAAAAQEGPDLIFRKSTDFKLLTLND